MSITELVITNIFPLLSAIFLILFIIVFSFMFIKALKNIDLSDLLTHEGTKVASHSKLWSSVAYFAATISFLAMNIIPGIAAQGGSLELIWMIYLGIVASNAVASKWISMKYRNDSETAKIQAETQYRSTSAVKSRYLNIDSPD